MPDNEDVVTENSVTEQETASGGPVPGSSAITVEDAPPVVEPVVTEDPEPTVETVEAPKPAQQEAPAISATTLAEQELGRRKVEERQQRDTLVGSARAAGNEETRVAQALKDNEEL